jgi:XTP/dITP diphosphohydrolase
MSFPLEGKVIFFATGNVNKFKEARIELAKYNIAAAMIRVKTLEIQSESLEEIAKASALDAYEKCGLPVIVEDAGLFTEALNGFPGPYASYVYKTIGNEGLLRLMKNMKNRKAVFRSVIAHCSSDFTTPICFSGEVEGEITLKERKDKSKLSFGFDTVFKPLNSAKTFAEMSIAEKNRFSHRARALRKFAEWYRSLYKSKE